MVDKIVSLSKTIGEDIKELKAQYSIQVIWAEENGVISANQTEYSYGNGSTGNIGIPCFANGVKAIGMLMQSETIGTSATVALIVNAIQVGGEYEIVSTEKDSVHYFTTPLDIELGKRIGFRTTTVTGAWTDVRVGVILAIPLINI